MRRGGSTPSHERNRSNKEENSTEANHAWPYKVNGLSVSNGLFNRGNDDRQIPTDVIHDEQEEANTDGFDVGINDLHDDGEQNREPGFSTEVI